MSNHGTYLAKKCFSLQFRFGKITVDSKTLDKLYKHFKHIPGVCFARTLELVRGRKYCLKHVLMGTHQVKGGFEVKEREDLISMYSLQ